MIVGAAPTTVPQARETIVGYPGSSGGRARRGLNNAWAAGGQRVR